MAAKKRPDQPKGDWNNEQLLAIDYGEPTPLTPSERLTVVETVRHYREQNQQYFAELAIDAGLIEELPVSHADWLALADQAKALGLDDCAPVTAEQLAAAYDEYWKRTNQKLGGALPEALAPGVDLIAVAFGWLATIGPNKSAIAEKLGITRQAMKGPHWEKFNLKFDEVRKKTRQKRRKRK